ncbi:hypothetical protein TrLO_g2985 [Triparma laevis f. longispina]|uniref:Uncharacterized protein n=1 Tax=Triparma laevis f. longispina TaxID=1714387 RepID=A0A9W7A2Z6_9STRA|nr:hypothetical protein TrLO_g2985 [Triparma laevis f. longispina]
MAESVSAYSSQLPSSSPPPCSPCSPQHSKFFSSPPAPPPLGYVASSNFNFDVSLPTPLPQSFNDCPLFASGPPLKISVRHLCSHFCFYRAYNPIRKWYKLYKRVELAGFDPESILEGWACFGRMEKLEKRFENVFVAPNGETFLSIKRVMEELKIDETGAADGGGIKKFPRAVIEAENLQSTSWRDMDPTSSTNKRLKMLSSPTTKDTTTTTTTTTTTSMSSPSESLWPGKNFHFSPSRESPFGLLEELTFSDPWKLLLTCILLNRTTRIQVDPVLFNFLERWPTCDELLKSRGDLKNVQELVRPCGMHLKRGENIVSFSSQYAEMRNNGVDPWELTEAQIRSFVSCGDYAWDAYRLFVLNLGAGEGVEDDFNCKDHALQMFLEWKRGVIKATETDKDVEQ